MRYGYRRVGIATKLFAGILGASGVLVLAGCGRGSPPPGPPAPAVTVSRPVQREVIEWDEYTGHLESPGTVDVRARVSGLLEKATFKEGGVVQKGDTLFAIDVRPFQAELDAKQADVKRAEAQAALAQTNLDRTQQAAQSNAVSRQELDTAKANLQQAEAAILSAQAAVESARLNVEWCEVTAPLTGRVSNKLVTEGNLVTAQQTLLTTITSVDPMYCYVDVDEASVLKYQQLAREKKRVSARNAQIPCFVQLGNEKGFPHEGVVDFVDNHIDPNTGTLRARGVISNANGDLQPGSFARTRVPGSGRYTAMLIPDQAVGTLQNFKFLLVVGDDDMVESRQVTLGTLFGTLRVITDGLNGDERIIVDGMQRAHAGVKVSPKEVPVPPDAIALTAPGSPTTQALPVLKNLVNDKLANPNAAAAELHDSTATTQSTPDAATGRNATSQALTNQSATNQAAATEPASSKPATSQSATTQRVAAPVIGVPR